MNLTRRQFVSQTAFLTAGGAAVGAGGNLDAAEGTEPIGGAPSRQSDARPLIVSTWPFGKPANEAALAAIRAGGSTLDGVEQGIWHSESDSGNGSVGLSGIPNAAGFPQLDACIMWGPGHQAGSVAAIEGIVHPISAARRVMEKTPHVMLAGEGARWFALEEGLESVPVPIPAEGRLAAWRKRQADINAAKAARERKEKRSLEENHDTIALLILDADGNLGGGCSTSGWGGKLPGRVGDSPIIGSGLYVDNEVGAAGATGLGENVMRYCASFMVVDRMRQGLDPETACVETIRAIARKDPRGIGLSINFVAVDKHGRYGAAGTGNGFSYAVTTPAQSGVLRSAGLSDVDVGPVGGNRFE